METAAKYKPKLEVLANREALARRTLELFVAEARAAMEAQGVFRTAVSGGNTPRRFFELLGEDPESLSLPWEQIHLFWVDERCVPPDSPWSNYKLAVDTFLQKVGVPQENVHRIVTEYSDCKEGAMQYEQTIREVFGLQGQELPRFDLILLGMGSDGHVGSLFPNSYAPFDTEDLACVVYVLDEKLNRITLTHPVLRAAARLAVLVSGREKAEILREVLTSEPDEVKYPIHTLWCVLDRVVWLVDKDAASLM